MEKDNTIIELGPQRVGIEQGELVSYQIDQYELIHQKGSPGWRQSDTEMFPIIGPLDRADYLISTPNGTGQQDQHGLLRELNWELIYTTETEAHYHKRYRSGEAIANSKYPEKSRQQWLQWPYDFEVFKKFSLVEGALRVRFEILGEANMPYMFGYHPAFRLIAGEPFVEEVGGDRRASLKEILAAGSRALEFGNCTEVFLKDVHTLHIRTEGFGHFMLWTEVPNMLCIEPITFYPYALPQAELHRGFHLLRGTDTYAVELRMV